jgi:hypothetical protein
MWIRIQIRNTAWRDPWSPATIGPLCLQSHDNLCHRLPEPGLPRFHSVPCMSSSSSQHSDQLNPPVKLLGGRPVEALQLHSKTQSYWSSVSTVSFPPREAAVRVLGMHPHRQWNRVLLLAMSCYRRFNANGRSLDWYNLRALLVFTEQYL